MLAIDIPGFGSLRLEHLLLDYNGTLAIDGRLIAHAAPLLHKISRTLQIHVVTADTFGLAAGELAGLPLQLVVMGSTDQAEAKVEFVRRLNAKSVVAIGNGRNDCKMVELAALGIAVLQREGAAQAAVRTADLVVPSILDALELLQHPLRLTATLRS